MTEWQRSDNQWRQGFLLDDDALIGLELCRAEELGHIVVMVISQDCDLTQDPRQEPQIEVVVGRVVEREDGNNTIAKNARKLHLEIEHEGGRFWAEFVATDKSSVDKWALNQYGPRIGHHLLPENLTILQRWLASRYRRSAFPDQFERRLDNAKLKKKISNISKRLGANISGIFFDVDEGHEISREDPDDTYLLDITVLYTTAPDPLAAERDATQMVEDIRAAFEQALFQPNQKWQQIELRFCEAISEAALTYEMFRQLKKWNLDHLSLAEEPQQPIVE